ncbi:MAG: hypothetical protein ACN4GZ_05620 [Acidimicrobiales bacterium]
MTTLRAESVSHAAANLLANVEVRTGIERVLESAGVTTSEAISMIAGGESWTQSLDFRCEPAGRQVDGIETAAIMDTHDDLAGTLMVGCRKDAVEEVSTLLTSLGSGQSLGVNERAQEAANIIGSAYLNGLRSTLDGVDLSARTFLPSPPRFLRSSVETMMEMAVGGQALGDRGWIADHRLRSGAIQVVLVWIPTAEAIVTLGTMAPPPVPA